MARDLRRPLREAWIVDAVRTPIGRYGGALAAVRPDDLAAVAIGAIVERTGIDPSLIEDVVLGCANGAGEDNRNVARMAALLAGLPVEVAGQTVNRLCGSGLQAVNSAAHAIGAGDGDVFVAGGVESMTRAPYVVLKAEGTWDRGARTMEDTTLGWRFVNPKLAEHANHFGIALRDHSTIERRIFELAVITVCRAWSVQYAWSSHAPQAEQQGIAPEIVEAIRENQKPDFKKTDERVAYEVASEIMATRELSKPSYDKAIAQFGEQGTVELISTIGYYAMVGIFLKSFDVPTPTGDNPLK